MDIRRRVANLIKKWGTRNPKTLCKYLNVTIIYEDLGMIKGFYTKCLRRKIIFINENLESDEQKMVLAHELGHSILHGKDILMMKSCFVHAKDSKYENEANLFTFFLLKEENCNLIEYSERCCLSYEAMDNLNGLKK